MNYVLTIRLNHKFTPANYCKMSLRNKSLLIISFILIADQILKIWIKTSFPLGRDIPVFGNWFILHFIENPGMAFGMKFWGIWGKIFLSIFRIIAIIAIALYTHHLIKQNIRVGLVFGLSLILAGAIGNLIDSAFYGMVFDTGMVFDPIINDWIGYAGISKMNLDGYSGFLKGCVVDMFYFPVINTTWPSWVPVFGGSQFIFFRPVFNIADAAITSGVLYLLVFQRKTLFEK